MVQPWSMTALNGMAVDLRMGEWFLPCLQIIGSSSESTSTDLKILIPFMVIKPTKFSEISTLSLTYHEYL